MPFKRFVSYLNSIQMKLSMGLALFLLPILMLVIFNSIFFNGFVRDQIANSNQNATGLFLDRIDSSLNDIDQYLVDLAMETRISKAYSSQSNSNEYSLSVLELSNRVNKDILLYSNVDSVFIWLPERDDMVYALNRRATYQESLIVNSNIRTMFMDGEQDNLNAANWQVAQAGGGNYLLRIIRAGTACVGAWIKLSTVERSVVETKDYPLYILIDDRGRALGHVDLATENNLDLTRDLTDSYLTGDPSPYLVVGQYSQAGQFGLASVVPYRLVYSSNSYFRQVIILMAIAMAVILPIYLLILHKAVVAPVRHILKTMHDVRDGRLDTRIRPIRTSREFKTVNKSFNDMLDQIHHLKIDIYEEKISRHRMAIERLQLQVKPHFFLNALSILNTLARTRKYDLMIEMNQCLIEYFRYMFRSDMSYVSLRDEILHVENYIRIQELRFPDRFVSVIEIDDSLLDMLVPPLIIHTFVENGVKYAMSLERGVHFNVTGTLEFEQTGGQMAVIRIGDTGAGFAPAILDRLQSGEAISDERGEHIGISNLKQRMDHFYRQKASLDFRNRPEGGAEIEIRLPVGPNDINTEVI